ncbi:MAG: VWA domain-containing protein [Sphingomonadales bacterium]|nr:VWA domain-containing protein [Sphingomonadales bacterium]MBD3772193.1 VWA domain-containing protein [Paracoccaceae bacterium]
MNRSHHLPRTDCGTFLRRLLRDRAGNTLAMIAAAILPIMAMVGGGVDMGRSYLTQSRLQQACDSGVLAARKRLGSEAAVTGEIPSDVAEMGRRFFNINFRNGSYGSTDRTFEMTLESNYAISGTASARVPTTIMKVFGFDHVDVNVDCEAQMNFQNTDVMMVLDVTGSMNSTNPGDSMSRLDALKQTIVSFHAQLESAKAGGARIRYGFVPFSTNVNVGALLRDEWMVNQWTYQSRELSVGGPAVSYQTRYSYLDVISGTYSETTQSTYDASYNSAKGTYSCPTKPTSTYSYTSQVMSTTTEAVVGPPPGTRTISTIRYTENGDYYSAKLNDSTCTVTKQSYVNYVTEGKKITEPVYSSAALWQYKPISYDVSDWRTSSNGCIEERDTYDITDYDNVDLTKAIDLDIDRVPDPTDPATQWRPQYPGLVYAREILWDYTGKYKKGTSTTLSEYVSPYWAGLASCPSPAKKLSTMTDEEMSAYVGTLTARGSTYHDIGMIWGARLLSPTGIFADENADVDGLPTSRNLIYLTDGYTSTVDLSYSAYGLEPIDERRWKLSDATSLNQTVINRFSYVCQELKKKNVTVWIISFGTEPQDAMVQCAGPGHYFQAKDAQELNTTFAAIAKSLSELRIDK